jgi:putative tryptophan/tyrosine transport system substrate-binding protein
VKIRVSEGVVVKSGFGLIVAAALFSLCASAEAQPAKARRVGVLVPGSVWYETLEGFRAGLRELGIKEGEQITLTVRDWHGDNKAAEQAVKELERDKVDLVYSTSSGGALAAKRATTGVPVVFCAGTDPVVLGLVESFAKPGGRFTGVHYRSTDLTAKRFEILTEIVPGIRNVVTFYNPRVAVAAESSKSAREAAERLGIRFIERHYDSLEDLRAKIRALKGGEAGAFFAVADPAVDNEYQLIIDTSRARKSPTMFAFFEFVEKGGLAGYAVSNREVGRVSAKYVQRILNGVNPSDLPVESVDKIELFVNQKTAKQIGVTIPPNVLARADRVIK